MKIPLSVHILHSQNAECNASHAWSLVHLYLYRSNARQGAKPVSNVHQSLPSLPLRFACFIYDCSLRCQSRSSLFFSVIISHNTGRGGRRPTVRYGTLTHRGHDINIADVPYNRTQTQGEYGNGDDGRRFRKRGKWEREETKKGSRTAYPDRPPKP